MSKNNKSRGTYNTELTEKQMKFVENYLIYENASKSYMIAYEQEDENAAAVGGNRLMKLDKVKAEIGKRKAEIKIKGIATPEDLLQFWTNALADTNEAMGNRLKASENMGKYYAMFVDRVETTGQTEFVINIAPPSDNMKHLKVVDMPVEQIEHDEAEED